QASFTVPGPNSGTSTVTATAGTATSDSATIDWISTTATKFTLTPTSINAATGSTQTWTAKVTDTGGSPIAGVAVDYQVAGVNPKSATLAGTTDVNGQVTFSYVGANAGDDTVTAFTDLNSNTQLDTGELSATAQAHWGAPASISISPTSMTTSTGTALVLTATVLDASSNPVAGVVVNFTITGANPTSGSATTDANGEATFSDPGTHTGTDTVNAAVPNLTTAVATIQWVAGATTLALSASNGTPNVNSAVTITATLTDNGGHAVPNTKIYFTVTGANTASGSATTDANGIATFSYTGTHTGADAVQAFADLSGNGTQNSGEPTSSTSINWGGGLALALAPTSQNQQVGNSASVAITLTNPGGSAAGVKVYVTVTGANPSNTSVTTDSTGKATFSYTGSMTGTDTITAYADLDANGSKGAGEPSATATVTWTASPIFQPAQPVPAKANCTYFPATQHNLCAGFAAYWNNFGGLAIFGMPITEEFQENGLTVQYFERARFEWHPGAWPARYDVELGLVGNEVTAGRQAETPFMPTTAKNSSDCTYYAATGHNLCAGFQAYWNMYGGLATYGFPISEEFQEKNLDTGQTYTVQYFQRGRFEWHPGEWPSRFDVELGRLGSQVLSMKYGVSYK
ncbi:MAG TPA: Ig-like domain-containing protein, partial [Nitrolancea sp.]|nr:Ig-like domain-containing protein [Nitrolancea sp.]